MKTRTGKSRIHGIGVFAREDILPGELIGIYEGRVLTAPIAKRDDPFVMWLEDDNGMSWGIRGEGQLRRLNHADSPNAVLGGGGPFVHALTHIKRGEEVTVHYGEYWEDE